MSIGKILTQTEFEQSPEKKLFGSYDNYIEAQANQLRKTSAWTFNPMKFIYKSDPTKAIQEYFAKIPATKDMAYELINARLDKKIKEGADAIAAYKSIEPDLGKAKEKYDNLFKKAKASEGDISSSDASELTKAKHLKDTLLSNYDILLSNARDITHRAV